MTELSSKMTHRLAAAVEKMPAFPKSVQRILELTRDINCDPRELVQIIEKDPVMTMKLLRILNSAYFSFSKQITSVNQSVVYLGLNTVKNLALSFAAMGTMPRQNAAGFDVERYLLHSLTTASLARTLCQRFGRDDTDPGDCYIAGLLHDFGKVVFAQFLADEFRRALALSAEQSMPLYLAEREVFGTDHTVVGGMLVEKWQFPDRLEDTIRNHHDADQLGGNTVQNCLFAANQISKMQASGCSGNPVVEAFPAGLQAYFGNDLPGLVASMGDMSGLMNEAALFARMSRED